MQAMQLSWQQREIDVTDPLTSSNNQAAAATVIDQREVEQQQLDAAIIDSMADMNDHARAPAAAPPADVAPRPLLSELLRADSAHLADSVTARGGRTLEYWDDILDGPTDYAVSRGACDGIKGSDPLRHVSRGGTGGCSDPNADDDDSNGDGLSSRFSDGLLARQASDGLCAGFDAGGTEKKKEKNWEAVLAEALSVVEWDVADEITSEALGEGFYRVLLELLKNVLGPDERRRSVRDNNAAFRENVGRWVIGSPSVAERSRHCRMPRALIFFCCAF